jgi:hypothetical protein
MNEFVASALNMSNLPHPFSPHFAALLTAMGPFGDDREESGLEFAERYLVSPKKR